MRPPTGCVSRTGIRRRVAGRKGKTWNKKEKKRSRRNNNRKRKRERLGGGRNTKSWSGTRSGSPLTEAADGDGHLDVFLVFGCFFFIFVFLNGAFKPRRRTERGRGKKPKKMREPEEKFSAGSVGTLRRFCFVFFWFLLNIFLFAVLRDFGVAQRWPDASSYCQRGEIERKRERERERGKQDLMGWKIATRWRPTRWPFLFYFLPLFPCGFFGRRRRVWFFYVFFLRRAFFFTATAWGQEKKTTKKENV